MVIKREMISGKKAAIEMSMSTIIVIVLAVTFLILGLVLLRNIFQGATPSINKINDQTSKEIEKLFADEQSRIVVYLGTDKTAKIAAGTAGFSFVIAAKTLYGNSVGKFDGIQYTLELDKESDCYKRIGAIGVTKWFAQKLTTATPVYNNIDEFNQQDTAFAYLHLSIPDGTPICTQDVRTLFYDNTQEAKLQSIGGTTFTVQVIRNSVF